MKNQESRRTTIVLADCHKKLSKTKRRIRYPATFALRVSLSELSPDGVDARVQTEVQSGKPRRARIEREAVREGGKSIRRTFVTAIILTVPQGPSSAARTRYAVARCLRSP